MFNRKPPKTPYVPRHAFIRAGDIGANPREVEYEPVEAPAELPAPIVVPEPEPVPA